MSLVNILGSEELRAYDDILRVGWFYTRWLEATRGKYEHEKEFIVDKELQKRLLSSRMEKCYLVD